MSPNECKVEMAPYDTVVLWGVHGLSGLWPNKACAEAAARLIVPRTVERFGTTALIYSKRYHDENVDI